MVEIDGGYHDAVIESDLAREAYLRQHGWDIVRFTDDEVETDAEAVARAIAMKLDMQYEFLPRNANGSGMKNVVAPQGR